VWTLRAPKRRVPKVESPQKRTTAATERDHVENVRARTKVDFLPFVFNYRVGTAVGRVHPVDSADIQKKARSKG